jgi:hypothetical protein
MAEVATPDEKIILHEAAQDARPRWPRSGKRDNAPSVPQPVPLPGSAEAPLDHSIALAGEGCNARG